MSVQTSFSLSCDRCSCDLSITHSILSELEIAAKLRWWKVIAFDTVDTKHYCPDCAKEVMGKSITNTICKRCKEAKDVNKDGFCSYCCLFRDPKSKIPSKIKT